jgi:hypothetical protein
METRMNKPPVRFLSILRGGTQRRGTFFGLILLIALLAFEIFNYSTTAFALTDMLGSNLRFMGIRWATILALAFCGIDFAGIARLFTPEPNREGTAEVWYLFGAWLLAAAMNAILTWWGVAVAVRSHQELSSSFISSTTLTKVVPIFIAVLVWLIRVFIIGTFSMSGDRLFSQASGQFTMLQNSLRSHTTSRPSFNREQSYPARAETPTIHPSPSRPEPTYHPVGLAARPREGENTVTRQ